MHHQLQPLIEIIKTTVKQDIVSIILFGSAAKGHLKKEIDIDLLIIVKEYSEPVCKEYWKQIKKEGYQMFGIPIDPIFAEENVFTDFTSPFYLDVIADGKAIYGKDVLDKTAFERYNIAPKSHSVYGSIERCFPTVREVGSVNLLVLVRNLNHPSHHGHDIATHELGKPHRAGNPVQVLSVLFADER